MLLRDRAFLDRWEPTRPDSFYTLETHQRRLEMLRSDENFADFGIFLPAGDELVGRIQLSGISRGPFQNGRNPAQRRLDPRAREGGFP